MHDATATALREAAEEVGLDPDAAGVRVVGQLERFWIPVSDFAVTPIVALAARRPTLVAAPAEVVRIIEPPVATFLPDAPLAMVERTIRGWPLRYGHYEVDGLSVWGDDRARPQPARRGARARRPEARRPGARRPAVGSRGTIRADRASKRRPDGALVAAPGTCVTTLVVPPKCPGAGPHGIRTGGRAMRTPLLSLVAVALVASACSGASSDRLLRSAHRHPATTYRRPHRGRVSPNRRRTTASPTRIPASTRTSIRSRTTCRPSRSTSTPRPTPSPSATSTMASGRIRPASASRNGSTPSSRAIEPPLDDTFAIVADGGPTPFTDRDEVLLRIGLQARDVRDRARADTALTFVIDTSGSMEREGRLGARQGRARTTRRWPRP